MVKRNTTKPKKKGVAPVAAIPRKGKAHAALLADLHVLGRDDVDWKKGRVFSLVYHASDAHSAFLKEAHNAFFSENGLNPLAFQSLRRMEKDVVRMALTLLHGDANACGTMTSGGTESLLLAVKMARDHARKKKPWIRRPNIVLPRSAHPAFDKAGEYFGVALKHAALDDEMRVDMKSLKKLVDRNTVMVVASAPQYPHGVMDPIEQVGAFAQKKKLLFHVDACVGGMVLPFLEKLGQPVPAWDFRVPGVTTISADLHKYGYTAKGASVILHRSIATLKHQFFVATEFPGGVYISPSMPGTRPGGPIAAAWAGMQAMGEDGYLALTQKALTATQKLRAGIRGIEGLRLVGDDPTTIVCWSSSNDAIDVYAVADAMQDKGWLVDRQHQPPTVHLTVTANHLPIVDEYLRDLRASVAHVRAHPELKSRGDAAMYGIMARMPIRGAVKLAVDSVIEEMYGPENSGEGGARGDGPVAKLLDKYGATAIETLDRLANVKKRAKTMLAMKLRTKAR
ncbi:MAG: aspartate aminotransferase family protein [Sandaracinaceae bacterium]|nr:aspartate aminotransferase family protein [Sandaracinaceae bacterium]